jgi:Domain of unknown function (DUF4145)
MNGKSVNVKQHCNQCLGLKNHVIVHSEQTRWDEQIDENPPVFIDGGDIWDLMRCLGCDAVRLKHRSWFSEATDESGNPAIEVEFFPPTITRQKPQWRRQFLPFSQYLNSLNGLSDEIYGALAAGSYRLATMGIRALAERVMIEQIGDKGRFVDTVQAFFEAGHVAPNQQEIFKNTLIEAGHAAMHRGFEPSADTVNTLLDIIEGVIHSIHYAPMLAAQVRKTIPSRPSLPI